MPFIEGDGTGPDIWRASVRVFDAAVAKAYGGKRKIAWMEVYAGEKAFTKFNTWLPDETVDAFREFLVGIKGPLTTPDRRRHPLAQRRAAADARPLRLPAAGALVQGRALAGEASGKGGHGDLPREHRRHLRRHRVRSTAPTANKKFLDLFKEAFPKEYAKIRFPETTGIGIKPVSQRRHRAPGPRRDRVRHRQQAQERDAGAQGQHHEVHRRRLPRLGLRPGRDASSATRSTPGSSGSGPRRPRAKPPPTPSRRPRSPSGKILIKDAIADITLQQVLTRPDEFDVIATLNLNGDYLSDALAAQVGGIGIAPGGNINYLTGHAVFEATHGTAPKYANLDKVNPGSVILSGEMMLRYMGWTEAADLIIKGMDGAIGAKTVTYDFARLMEGAKEVKCSEFGDAVIGKM